MLLSERVLWMVAGPIAMVVALADVLTSVF